MALQQFDQEMVSFAKKLLSSFDEIIIMYKPQIDVEFASFMDELVAQGYDGTIQSVLYNDNFWDELVIDFIQLPFIYRWLIQYNGEHDNIIDKLSKIIHPIIYNHNILSSLNYSYYTFCSRWNEYYKQEIRKWTEEEFGISPK